MPFLYRPKIIRYRLGRNGPTRTPDGKPVTKATKGAVRHDETPTKWYGRWADRDGVWKQEALSENKDVARRMLAKLSGDAQLAKHGLDDRYEEHRNRALMEHVDEYGQELEGAGRSRGHVKKTCSRIRAILAGCRFQTLEDIQASSIVRFLADLRQPSGPMAELNPGKEDYTRTELAGIVGIHPDSVARLLRRDGLSANGNGKARRYPAETVQALQARLGQGAGVATTNHYLTAIKAFTRWLTRDRRIPADPLSHLARQNPEVDVRRERRALSEKDFVAFMEATRKGKPFRGLKGADRLVLYTLASNTGFRAGELASLSPVSFLFERDRASVRVEAAYSKHRRNDELPLRADVAEMIRQYAQGKPRRQPLWPGTWKDVAAEMLRNDLHAAGLPYQDEDGRYFDFHCLRGQFISTLAAKGVHPKKAQTLARHSDVRLTMKNYTHLDVFDGGLAEALEKLPEIAATPVARKRAKSESLVQHKCNTLMA